MNGSKLKTTTLALAGVIALAVAGWAAAEKSGRTLEVKTVDVKAKETVEIVVSGQDGKAETVRIEDLAPGQSKEIKTSSGKKATVKRGENGYTVKLDGKEIVVEVDDDPLGRMGSGSFCAPRMEVRRHGHGHGHGHGGGSGCCCCGSGHGAGARPERMRIVTEDIEGGEGGDRVVWMGHGGGHDEDVLMELPGHGAGPGTMMFIGEGGRLPGHVSAEELEKLDAMKGVDPKTRDKVLEVLKELESKLLHGVGEGPVVIRKKVVVDAPDGEGPGEKQVKVIVIREGDDETPAEKKEGKK